MSKTSTPRTPAERITLVLSSLLLIGMLGAAVWFAFGRSDAPPAFDVEADIANVRQEGDLWYVPVTVTNTGGHGVESAVVSGELATDDPQPEQAEFTVDFLAAGESETGEMIFTTQPDADNLDVHVTSYQEP